MRILVTGGTGLLGNTILRQLTSDGHDVRALIRGEPSQMVFQGIEAEFFHADLNDLSKINSAVEGCDAVIHCAGLIHIGWHKLDESMIVNRDGTRNLVNACRSHSAALVHVGTVNTLAIGSRTNPADETTPLDHAGGQISCSYVESKRAGVDVALDGVSHGLRATIIHPGFMMGPWDWKPSSGRMIQEVAKTWRPIAPAGGCSVCDSRDVACGVITAMHRLIEGKTENGRQYILAGENWTYFELWKHIAERTGRRRPIMPAGPAQRIIGQLVGNLTTQFKGEESDLNSAAVRMSSQFHWYDSSRARDELGYRTRQASQSIDDAVDWLSGRGALKP